MHLRKHGTTYVTIDHHVGFGGFATVDGTVPSGKFPVESLIVNMPFWEEELSTDFVKPNLELPGELGPINNIANALREKNFQFIPEPLFLFNVETVSESDYSNDTSQQKQ